MLQITPLEAFDDNYIWAIQDIASNRVIVVDPGDAEPVLHFINQQQLQLEAILITHHHSDHTGGVQTLSDMFGIPVYGPVSDNISGITDAVNQQTTLNLMGYTVEVLAAPGHTLDHLLYVINEGANKHLFSGDTLFSAGCGRVFEGTAAQLFRSILQIKQLPNHTQIYPAHEYTTANLQFSKAVEPANEQIEQVIGQCNMVRQSKRPTLPTTLEAECQINPFLRTNNDDVISTVSAYAGRALSSEEEVFCALRAWKDHF